jgi:hypothetical protein
MRQFGKAFAPRRIATIIGLKRIFPDTKLARYERDYWSWGRFACPQRASRIPEVEHHQRKADLRYMGALDWNNPRSSARNV